MQRVIHNGAIRLVIPRNFPIGCQPIYQTVFETNSSKAYDEYHCLKNLNFSKYHNRHLRRAIKELEQENPNVAIAYGDYYPSFQWVFPKHNILVSLTTVFNKIKYYANSLGHNSIFVLSFSFLCLLKDLIPIYYKSLVAALEATTSLMC